MSGYSAIQGRDLARVSWLSIFSAGVFLFIGIVFAARGIGPAWVVVGYFVAAAAALANALLRIRRIQREATRTSR